MGIAVGLAATGVLPIVLGRGTKIAQWIVAGDKTYRAVCELGATTDTLDVDGTVLERHPIDDVDADAVRTAARRLTGAIEQIPPMYSAVKVGGERLYEKARRGEVVERAPRRVTVHELDVEAFERALVGPDAERGVVAARSDAEHSRGRIALDRRTAAGRADERARERDGDEGAPSGHPITPSSSGIWRITWRGRCGAP